MTKNPLKNIKGCRCLSLLMTENPFKNIKGCQCLFLLTTGNTLKISGTKFFQYWFRDFFSGTKFPQTDSETFLVPNFSDTGSDTIKKREQFPGTGIPGTGTSHSAEQPLKWCDFIFRAHNVKHKGKKTKKSNLAKYLANLTIWIFG